MIEINFKQAFINCNEHREWLTEALQAKKVSVHFVKKDGTEREMVCTLNQSLIPAEFAPKGTERVKPTESIAVFDVEKNEWRSFRWESVKTFTI